MNDKKSFIVYHDNALQFDQLDDERLGKLFRAMYRYAADHEMPVFEDPLLQMAFSFVSGQMDRDAEKYEEICRRRSEAGRKGGRPKANDSFALPEEAKKADSECEYDGEVLREVICENEKEKENVSVVGCDMGEIPGLRSTPPVKPVLPASDGLPSAGRIMGIAASMGYSWDADEANRFLEFNRARGRRDGWEFAVQRWEKNRDHFGPPIEAPNGDPAAYLARIRELRDQLAQEKHGR